MIYCFYYLFQLQSLCATRAGLLLRKILCKFYDEFISTMLSFLSKLLVEPRRPQALPNLPVVRTDVFDLFLPNRRPTKTNRLLKSLSLFQVCSSTSSTTNAYDFNLDQGFRPVATAPGNTLGQSSTGQTIVTGALIGSIYFYMCFHKKKITYNIIFLNRHILYFK